MDAFTRVQNNLGNWEKETQQLLQTGKDRRQVLPLIPVTPTTDMY